MVASARFLAATTQLQELSLSTPVGKVEDASFRRDGATVGRPGHMCRRRL